MVIRVAALLIILWVLLMPGAMRAETIDETTRPRVALVLGGVIGGLYASGM